MRRCKKERSHRKIDEKCVEDEKIRNLCSRICHSEYDFYVYLNFRVSG